MTLKDQMASDMTDVFLNTDEFADDAAFIVKDGQRNFAITVVIGDPLPTYVQIDGGTEDRRPVSIMASRAAIRTGITGITGTPRDPIKGDAIEVATGAYTGIWRVQTAQADDGDGMLMQCVKADLNTANGANAREIR